MTRFFLIRHGAKDSPDPILTGQSAGIALTPRGREQAEAIATLLASEAVHHVISSPLERARETAAPLAKQKRLSVEIDPAFHEFQIGDWTMKNTEALAGSDAWKHFNQFRAGTRAPGGETMLEVQNRFVGAMLRLRERFPEHGVAIVSHGDPIRAALTYFAGCPIDFWARFEISIGSVTTLDLAPWGVQVQQVNRVPLPR